jgi:DNA-binding transcriptional MerR regulator/methylmalonyl-CoA mutase cobalamin-binding subunit
VVSSRTGVSPTLLRAWERRYQVVDPGRSDGGQRLYSDDDIERLLLLKRATDAGRAIRSVAGLPIDELRALVREDRSALGPAEIGDERVDGALAAAWSAVEAMDAEGLETELRRAVVTLGASAFTDRLVAPLLRTIGQRWVEGRMRPSHEHMATEVIKRVLHWMVEPSRGETGGPGVVVGTLSGEMHELGALLAGATAALEGWNVTFLGQDLPPDEFAHAAETVSAKVVGISTVNPLSVDGIPGQLEALLGALPADVSVVLGGPSASDLLDRIADSRLVAVDTLADFRTVLGELMHSSAGDRG